MRLVLHQRGQLWGGLGARQLGGLRAPRACACACACAEAARWAWSPGFWPVAWEQLGASCHEPSGRLAPGALQSHVRPVQGLGEAAGVSLSEALEFPF